VAFRYIAAGTHPDHDTLASFRRRCLGELEELFVHHSSIGGLNRQCMNAEQEKWLR
jgi:hypothetical protein